MQVFVFDMAAIISIGDSELQTAVDSLIERHIKIAVVTMPVVYSTDSCGHTEGYTDERSLTAGIEKLRRLRIPVTYMAMDGGLWFGHFAKGDQECGLSLDKAIEQVAVTMRQFKKTFPAVIVGDIEPTTPLTDHAGWMDDFTHYKQSLEQRTGVEIAFLQLDIAWGDPKWRQSITDETALAKRLGMRVGYIYDGVDGDRSDEQWLAHAKRNVDDVEQILTPDQAIIATWNDFPRRVVGASLGGTLEALLDYYGLQRVSLSVKGKRDSWFGYVKNAVGDPIANYILNVVATTQQFDGKRLPQISINGSVPTTARTAIVGLRVNTECLCAGNNDFILGAITYSESGTENATTIDFDPELRRSGIGTESVYSSKSDGSIDERRVRLRANPHETILLNSKAFKVVPGHPFKLQASFLDLLDSDFYGAITLIWLDEKGGGISRDSLHGGPSSQVVKVIKTNAKGEFFLSINHYESEHFGHFYLAAGDNSRYRGFANVQLR